MVQRKKCFNVVISQERIVGFWLSQFQCQAAAFFSHAYQLPFPKQKKTSTMRDKKLCHKFKLLWNSSQARSLYKTCHLPISDTFNHFQILLRADLLLTACISYLPPPQALKYVHMRSISSWMRHWKVYEDLNLKQQSINWNLDFFRK